jgi:hypothetical protein
VLGYAVLGYAVLGYAAETQLTQPTCTFAHLNSEATLISAG